MSPRDPLLDERFEEIVAQLREAKPHATAELRMRVREVSRAEPAPRRRSPLRARLVPAFAATVLLAAAIAGVALLNGDGGAREGAGGGEAVRSAPQSDAMESAEPEAAPEAVAGADDSAATVPPPSTTRLQDYSADLTVHVEDVNELSRATAQAMATARRLGGFVVTARYDRPSGADGESFLVVRVPVTKVQQALAAYSELGTIVAQQVAIQVVQPAYNRLLERIEAVQARVARLAAQLDRRGLTDDERLALRSQLEAARAELRALGDQRRATLREARLARIALTLTTYGPDTAPSPPGEAEQTLRDAIGALATVSVWLLAALIVVAPFVLLGVAAIVGARRLRRRSAERLLERPGS